MYRFRSLPRRFKATPMNRIDRIVVAMQENPAPYNPDDNTLRFVQGYFPVTGDTAAQPSLHYALLLNQITEHELAYLEG